MARMALLIPAQACRNRQRVSPMKTMLLRAVIGLLLACKAFAAVAAPDLRFDTAERVALVAARRTLPVEALHLAIAP